MSDEILTASENEGRGREGARGERRRDGLWMTVGRKKKISRGKNIMDEGFKTISICKHLYGFGYRLSLHFLYYCLLHI